MTTISYNFKKDGKIVRNFNYDEHFLDKDEKVKFNVLYLTVKSDVDINKIYKSLLRDRLKSHDWIEFISEENSSGYYVAVYCYLGAYVIRLGTKSRERDLFNEDASIIKSFSWYKKYNQNKASPFITKNLFSLTETAKIIVDINRVNSLNLFK